jgi:molybdate transport system substrate-binding protein
VPTKPKALVLLVVVATAAGVEVAATRSAGEIRVMTSGAFAAAHTTLSPRYAKATGDAVVTVTTSTGVGADAIPARLKRGEAADVIVLPEAALDGLIADGLIVKASKVNLARSAIGMGVRSGAPKPDISTVDALRRTLLAAKSIAYSASVSGVYLSTELFPKLGIADQLKAKSRRVETERVGAVVARGEAEVGFQQITELLEVPGVDLVGPLPAEVQRITVVAAGVASSSKNPSGARALIEYFASKDAAATISKVGLEPVAQR